MFDEDNYDHDYAGGLGCLVAIGFVIAVVVFFIIILK